VKRTRTETVEVTGSADDLTAWMLGNQSNGNRVFFS